MEGSSTNEDKKEEMQNNYDVRHVKTHTNLVKVNSTFKNPYKENFSDILRNQKTIKKLSFSMFKIIITGFLLIFQSDRKGSTRKFDKFNNNFKLLQCLQIIDLRFS